MNDIRLHLSDLDLPQDVETREARHEILASLLGAFADGELPAETQSQVDAHLTGCARCRRELDVHNALRERLGNEPVPAASAALRMRIAAGIKLAPPPAPVVIAEEPIAPKRPRVAPRVLIAAAGLIAILLAVATFTRESASTRNSVPVSIASAGAVPLLRDVLADYRRVTASELPGRARDLVAMRAAVPFDFTPLSHPSLHLFAAWTTSLAGEPAVVLAYRWNARVVYQYLVTEGLLFQSPAVRASLAQKPLVSAIDGGQGMLLWAEPAYGTILVGDFRPEEFVQLRDVQKGR